MGHRHRILYQANGKGLRASAIESRGAGQKIFGLKTPFRGQRVRPSGKCRRLVAFGLDNSVVPAKIYIAMLHT